MPRNNPTRATVNGKVRTRFRPSQAILQRLKRLVKREKNPKPPRHRQPRAR